MDTDDESDSNDTTSVNMSATNDPWTSGFNAYIDVLDGVPEGVSLVQWWGVCYYFLLPFCLYD